MRAPWLLVGLWFVAIGCGVARASETDCYSIKDQDRKNLCLATSKRQASYCYAIKNADSKSMCLARVDLKKSHCYSIKDKDSQKECLAMFR
jgi:hypothetical protein